MTQNMSKGTPKGRKGQHVTQDKDFWKREALNQKRQDDPNLDLELIWSECPTHLMISANDNDQIADC